MIEFCYASTEIEVKYFQQVELEGMTGNISFSDDGHRQKFSLDVVEMTSNSQTVKVLYVTFLKVLF